MLAEKVGANYTQRYVWSLVYVDAMVLRDRDTNADGTLDERLWVQQDANWNVTAIVNGSGTVVERYAYDAYGVVTVLDGSFGSRGASSYAWDVYWQGMRLDGVSTSYKSRGRTDISPTLGRPFQLDPLGIGAGDVNFYRWEANNPTSLIDPSGLEWISTISVGGSTTVGTGAGGSGQIVFDYFGGNDPVPYTSVPHLGYNHSERLGFDVSAGVTIGIYGNSSSTTSQYFNGQTVDVNANYGLFSFGYSWGIAGPSGVVGPSGPHFGIGVGLPGVSVGTNSSSSLEHLCPAPNSGSLPTFLGLATSGYGGAYPSGFSDYSIINSITNSPTTGTYAPTAPLPPFPPLPASLKPPPPPGPTQWMSDIWTWFYGGF